MHKLMKFVAFVDKKIYKCRISLKRKIIHLKCHLHLSIINFIAKTDSKYLEINFNLNRNSFNRND